MKSLWPILVRPSLLSLFISVQNPTSVCPTLFSILMGSNLIDNLIRKNFLNCLLPLHGIFFEVSPFILDGIVLDQQIITFGYQTQTSYNVYLFCCPSHCKMFVFRQIILTKKWFRGYFYMVFQKINKMENPVLNLVLLHAYS